MGSPVWVVVTLLVSIVLIVLTIVKLKFHPFLALLLASFFVGAMMGATAIVAPMLPLYPNVSPEIITIAII